MIEYITNLFAGREELVLGIILGALASLSLKMFESIINSIRKFLRNRRIETNYYVSLINEFSFFYNFLNKWSESLYQRMVVEKSVMPKSFITIIDLHISDMKYVMPDAKHDMDILRLLNKIKIYYDVLPMKTSIVSSSLNIVGEFSRLSSEIENGIDQCRKSIREISLTVYQKKTKLKKTFFKGTSFEEIIRQEADKKRRGVRT